VVIDLFQRGAQANLEHPDRKGAVINLPKRGRLLMTGDLHDHRVRVDVAGADVTAAEKRQDGEGGGQAEAASLRGRIQETIYLGAARKFIVRLADGTIVSIRPQRLDEAARLSVGDEVAVGWERRYGVVVPDARHPRTAGGEAERELSTAPPSS
jgi:ABC-type Fe3+/spermidine/putrescine transport system ATPase subunit